MAKLELDCKNLPCPQPVIRLKRQLDSGHVDSLTVIVDNEPALENVGRFLTSRGFLVTSEGGEGVWRINAQSDGETSHSKASPAPSTNRPGDEDARTLVMLLAPVFGSGDDVLGAKLMKNFLMTLPELEGDLWRVVMLNGGVTLSTKDSPVVDDLRRLEQSGVSILVCGSCLEHYGLLAEKAVGQTTNMLDVVTSMQLADKVIRV